MAMIRGVIPEGTGTGTGTGTGIGTGTGYGYGYGDGSGSGYGYGDGYGYWRVCLENFAAELPADQRARYEAARAAGLPLAYWCSDARGQPANGGRGVMAAAGVMHETAGPLRLCYYGTLHATLIPSKWKGERWWIVALHGEVVGDDEKMGCLKREIIGECV